MSKEYLNGQDLKPEKKSGFESRKNTILLSVILVLVLAFITSVVIILLKSKNKNEENPSDSQSVVVTEQTNPHKTGGLPQAGGELPSIEMTQTTPVETCPICGSTDFNAPDGEGYKSCKKCDTKWKESENKIIVIQDDGQTEITITHTPEVVISVTTTKTTTESSTTTSEEYSFNTHSRVELDIVGPGGTSPYARAGTYVVVAGSPNLREDPSSDSNWVATLKQGDTIYIDRTTNSDWGHTVVDGQEGWVMLRYVEKYNDN